MATPVRFPSGISVFPTRHTFNNFPSVPSQWQDTFVHNFMPYRSADFTLTQANGTATSYSWDTGALALATTNTVSTNFAYLTQGTGSQNQMQFIAGNQTWFRTKMALPASSGSTANVYAGLFDTPTNVATATNGVYFYKPAGGTVVHFIIKKAGVTTQFSNVADLAKPSGIYGDASSVTGVLGLNATGTTFTNVTVTTAGSGYVIAPLIIAGGTAGSGGALYAQLGSGGLYAPTITNPGSGYTAGTLTAEVDPWIALSYYYDGKNTFYVGVNGRIVLAISSGGVTTITPGQTYTNNTTGPSYNATGTQLTVGVSPVQPKIGDPINILPLASLAAVIGLLNSAGTAQTVYFQELDLGMEYN